MEEEKKYIKLDSDGVPIKHFVDMQGNVQRLHPEVDLAAGEVPDGWALFERREDSLADKDHRYFEYEVRYFWEGSTYVVHDTLVEVSDEKKAEMRTEFYAEDHSSASIWNETVGAWLRPDENELDSMEGDAPDVA